MHLKDEVEGKGRQGCVEAGAAEAAGGAAAESPQMQLRGRRGIQMPASKRQVGSACCLRVGGGALAVLFGPLML